MVDRHTITALETDPLGYITLAPVIHLESLRMGGLPWTLEIRGTKEEASRSGNDEIHWPAEDAPLEATDPPFGEHTYTGGDEVFKRCRKERLKR